MQAQEYYAPHQELKRSAAEAGLDAHDGPPSSKTRPEDTFYSSVGTPEHVADPLAKLDRSVREQLERIFRTTTVRRSDIDGKAIDELRSLSPDDGVAVLEQLEKAAVGNLRNPSAFLCANIGRLERYGANALTVQLNPELHKRLDQLYKERKLKAQQLDGKCLQYMSELPVQAGLLALEKLATMDLANTRNMSALLVSLLRKAEADMRHSGMAAAFYSAAGPPAAAAGAMFAAGPHDLAARLAGKRHFGTEQQELGVRVHEFHNLSVFCAYVEPAAALKLQRLWDQGNRLVSLLDDRAWELLSDLDAPEAIALIKEVAEAMTVSELRNVNAYFMAQAKKYLPAAKHHRHERPDTSVRRGSMAPLPISGYGAPMAAALPRAPWHAPDTSAHDRSLERGRSALHQLPSSLRMRAQELILTLSPNLQEHHFDEPAVAQLLRLSDSSAHRVLDELARSELHGVRNMSAFLMGIIKRQQRSR